MLCRVHFSVSWLDLLFFPFLCSTLSLKFYHLSYFWGATQGKKVFPSDESLSKSLYLAIVGIKKKWSGKKMKNWGIIYGQLKQIFEGGDLIMSNYAFTQLSGKSRI